MKLKPDKLPLFLILAGVLFSLYLVLQVPDEIFYSGDGGLKFLVAKQFSLGNFNIDIVRNVESWVSNLWREGLYPFGNKEPWIYYRENRYYSPFPFTFPVVTAPFYALFGFRGLYIIPLVSLWAIWYGFYQVCQRLKLGSAIASVALTILIFASPLTLYGAMYWEHTLAVALAFHGLAILFAPSSGELSRKEAILSGILIGLSVWFRGEFLCLVAIMCLFALASVKMINLASPIILLLSGIVFSLLIILKESSLWFIGIICLVAYASSRLNLVFKKREVFVASMLLTLSIYWILNLIIYHHPLGIHALQVVEHLSLRNRLNDAFKYFNSMNYDLFYYLPIAFFPIIYLIIGIFDNKLKLNPQAKILFITFILFSFSVPLLLPSEGGKQWGPRFLLILIPIISLLAIMTWQVTMKVGTLGFKYAISAVFFMLLALGIFINSYTGAATLVQGYQTSTIPNILGFLRKEPNQIVAVNHEFVSQSLVSVYDKKIFFLTKTPENLGKLGSALHKQGYQDFIYVCQRFNSCYPNQPKTAKLSFLSEGKTFQIDFSELAGVKGSLFKASIVEAATTSTSD